MVVADLESLVKRNILLRLHSENRFLHINTELIFRMYQWERCHVLRYKFLPPPKLAWDQNGISSHSIHANISGVVYIFIFFIILLSLLLCAVNVMHII